MAYHEFYQQSLSDPASFWAKQARRLYWQQPYEKVLDYSNPPFARWFCAGRTNLCYNALDRWLTDRPNATALVAVSLETGQDRSFTFRQLYREVNSTAAMLMGLGVQRGDRVLIYMPMVAEAQIVLLACARIGAIHSVVFGGFAAHSLAARIDDAKPTVIISADGGSRGGKIVAYKPLLDEAIERCQHPPRYVVLLDRQLAPMNIVRGRDLDYATLRRRHYDDRVQVVWLESNEVSCVLYTSGTTGQPKGVQRDVGGYGVALATSMATLFGGDPGGIFFCASDIGWVVGHSYIVYGPLLAGMGTVVCEGMPTWPDCGVWWRIVERYQVRRLFCAPTAIRVLKKYPTAQIQQYDLSSLEAIYLAGEPLDVPTSQWVIQTLGVPAIDNYWQTETGWPILGIARGVDDRPLRPGSPGVPMYGYKVELVDEHTGAPCADGQKGMLTLQGPLPPGCIQTIWNDDQRYLQTYWSRFDTPRYATFDWGVRDEDGYYFILGRSDDVINIAGHRLGTREIEESVSRAASVAEVAVVGVRCPEKGQVAVAFVVPRTQECLDFSETAAKEARIIEELVTRQVGAIAKPSQVWFVAALPKTRSGKLLRRTLQALCEGEDPGDLSTLDDPSILASIHQRLQSTS